MIQNANYQDLISLFSKQPKPRPFFHIQPRFPTANDVYVASNGWWQIIITYQSPEYFFCVTKRNHKNCQNTRPLDVEPNWGTQNTKQVYRPHHDGRCLKSNVSQTIAPPHASLRFIQAHSPFRHNISMEAANRGYWNQHDNAIKTGEADTTTVSRVYCRSRRILTVLTHVLQR